MASSRWASVGNRFGQQVGEAIWPMPNLPVACIAAAAD